MSNTFTHAIVRRPGENFARGLTTSHLGRPNYELMLRQHNAYIRTLQSLDLEELFTGPVERFVLQVNGESMIDEQIRDGDFVVCERRNTPRQGETVVALLPDGDATLKKFYKEDGRIRLQPANDSFEPIYVDNVEIQGVVVGVIRTL